MKYLVLVWAGLWRKPARTILTSLSVMTAFLLFGALNGTMVSFDKWIGKMTGDVAVLWTSSRVNVAAGLPIGMLPSIARIPGIVAVDIQQDFNSYWQDPKNGVGVVAIDVDRRIENPNPYFTVPVATMQALRSLPTGMVAGTDIMKKYGWKVGERVPLTSAVIRKDGSNVWAFDIVGSFESARPGASADQVWINFGYFDEARAFDNGTVKAITSVIADPTRATRVGSQIDALFANSSNETLTRSLGDMIRAELAQVTDIELIVNVILSAVLFTLLFVTGNTMMQSTVDRIPELAVLKTYGYSDAILAALILVEAALLCLVSALAGIALAASVLFPVIGAAFGVGTLLMDASVVFTGIAIAVTLACAIALPPVWRASRLNVVDALAGR